MALPTTVSDTPYSLQSCDRLGSFAPGGHAPDSTAG